MKTSSTTWADHVGDDAVVKPRRADPGEDRVADLAAGFKHGEGEPGQGLGLRVRRGAAPAVPDLLGDQADGGVRCHAIVARIHLGDSEGQLLAHFGRQGALGQCNAELEAAVEDGSRVGQHPRPVRDEAQRVLHDDEQQTNSFPGCFGHYLLEAGHGCGSFTCRSCPSI